LLDLAVIVVLARLLGTLARRLGQPAVIGEIIGGILLGPSLFGQGFTAALFPPEVWPSLATLANIGVCVFMFLVGMESDRALLRGQGSVAISVSVSAIVVPFALGVVLALSLLGSHSYSNRLGFVLFLGTAMSVTAFPVLARILVDKGLMQTRVGGLALASAALGDLLAWSMLMVVTALSGFGQHQWRAVLVVPFAGLLEWGVRPLLARLASHRAATGRWADVSALLIMSAGLWAAAEATNWMGLHPIFGAFLWGFAMPANAGAVTSGGALRWIERTCSYLLLPVFFMIAGLKVDLSRMNDAAFAELGLILLVAIGGKFVGTLTGAHLFGLPPRPSTVLAILLNTRGLTELIVLAVGVQIGVLDTRLYSLMVVMAVVTTAMTGVLLAFVYPDARIREDKASPIERRPDEPRRLLGRASDELM
jgi:Kef-type K+ transport system membrane component KefB